MKPETMRTLTVAIMYAGDCSLTALLGQLRFCHDAFWKKTVRLELCLLCAPDASLNITGEGGLLTPYRRINIDIEDSKTKDFAAARNRLSASSQSEWVLMLDPDETLSTGFVQRLPEMLHREVDAFAIPRENTLRGKVADVNRLLTKRGWRADEQGRINWPDYQWRLYRNDLKNIYWVGKQHEVLCHIVSPCFLKADGTEGYIVHPKSAMRQAKQLELETLLSEELAVKEARA